MSRSLFPVYEKILHPVFSKRTFSVPSDYAARLSVHVNHLNRSVKEITGKSTGTLINERIMIEAKALLQHTDWSVGDIAYSLGFEYPTHFNNSFKKSTGIVPKSVRAQHA